jgi:hypothetical protein
MKAVEAMTDKKRIAELMRALEGMLALVDERDATDGSRHIDARIAVARRAIAVTAPMKESSNGQPPDYPDVCNDLAIALQQLAAFAEMVERMNEVFA